MRPIALACLLLLPALARAHDCPVNLEPVGPINSMTKSNPNYKARAGGSYEEQMLPKAVGQFMEMAEAGTHYEAIRCALRVHIYDWLDMYCRNVGERDDAKHRELVKLLDQRLAPFLPEGRQEAYRKWKAENPLNFLMLELPDPAP